MRLVAHPAFRQMLQHMWPDDLAHFGDVDGLGMLGRDHHRSRAHRLAIDILQADLALGVGPEIGRSAGMPGLGQRAQDIVGVIDRCRHQLFGLAHGVAEHDALVAGALILVALRIDADGDVGRLLMDVAFDLGMLPMETGLLVADLADGPASGVDQHVMGHRGRAANLAGEHDPIGRRQGLHRDP